MKVILVLQFHVNTFKSTELCPTLNTPSNGQLTTSNGQLTTSNDGEFAFFSCNRGFNIRGSDVLQCINGEWNSPIPSCQLIPRLCRRHCGF